MSNSEKFILVSSVLPPAWSGQSIMIGRLLEGMSEKDYALASRCQYLELNLDIQHADPLPAKLYRLPSERKLYRGSRVLGRRRLAAVNLALAVAQRGFSLAKAIRRERAGKVVACSSDLIDIPAAELACRITGAQLFLYLFDDYVLQRSPEQERRQALKFEKRAMRYAAGVICPSEMLAKEVERRHGRQAHIVRNPTGRPTLPSAPVEPRRQEGPSRIVFTGSAYHMNFGSFHDVLAALAMPGSPRAVLELYTQLKPEELARNGIGGPNVSVCAQVPSSQVYSVQSGADVLLLPYAFDTLTPEIPLTAAPGKLGDYLASGRPILAQAPEGSFTAWYLSTYDCGMVVTQPGPEPIARALGLLLNSHEVARRLAANGLARARAEFTAAAAGDIFLSALGGN